MSGRKVDEKTVSIPEVKKIMEYVKKAIEDIDAEEGMSHFQEITYSYVNKYARMTDVEAQKVKKLLEEKYNLEEQIVINIINIFPKTILELKTILEKSQVGKSLKDDQLSEIIYQLEEIVSS